MVGFNQIGYVRFIYLPEIKKIGRIETIYIILRSGLQSLSTICGQKESYLLSRQDVSDTKKGRQVYLK